MLTDRDIVIISSIDRHELWQSHHEIATRFARKGNRVLFLENLGIRAPRLRDAKRLGTRIVNRVRSLRTGFRHIEPNLSVCSTLILPPWGSWLRRALNHRFFLPIAARTIKRMVRSHPLVLTFLPTDTASALAESIAGESGVIIYYAIADFEELAPDRELLRSSETYLAERADAVFANGESVAKRLRQWRSDVHVFPVGVNVETFFAEPKAPLGPRDERAFSAIRGPIIGYVGGLHRHVDFELVSRTARLRPEWTWVLVGPSIESTSSLEKIDNVVLLGRREHGELPSIIRRFDVGVVPYLTGASTRTVVPTKLNEYLACGKPVVSTRLPRSEEISHQLEDVIVSDDGPDSFVAAIESALRLGAGEAAIERRRRFASNHDWGPLLERMSHVIESNLARRESQHP